MGGAMAPWPPCPYAYVVVHNRNHQKFRTPKGQHVPGNKTEAQ